jgi:hypothetical protein
MTRRQKRAAAVVTAGAVILLALLMILFAGAGAAGELTGETPIGKWFLSLSANFNGLQLHLKSLAAIFFVGVALLGASFASDRLFVTLVVCFIGGILAIIVLLVMIADQEFAANLWQPSRVIGINSEESFNGAARQFLWWGAGALAVGLAGFLGVVKRKDGENA